MEHAQKAMSELGPSRAALDRDAARVYTNPQHAVRALLADPRAADRVAAGQVQAYGQQRAYLWSEAASLAPKMCQILL